MVAKPNSEPEPKIRRHVLTRRVLASRSGNAKLHGSMEASIEQGQLGDYSTGWVLRTHLCKVLCIHNRFGVVSNPLAQQRGRKRALTMGDIHHITTILGASPSLYLNKIQD